MGSDPFLVLRSRGEKVYLIRGGAKEIRRGNPFDVVDELLKVYSLEGSPAQIPFLGGAVGYFSYDLCHFIERVPSTAVDDLNLPECYLAFYDAIVAFDHCIFHFPATSIRHDLVLYRSYLGFFCLRLLPGA